MFVPFFRSAATAAARSGRSPRRLGDPVARRQAGVAARRSPACSRSPDTLSVDHARENLAALDLDLSDADVEALR